MICASFNGNLSCLLLQCHWWNGHHHLLQWTIFSCLTHSLTQGYDHQGRRECSYRQRQHFCWHKSSERHREYPADFSLVKKLPWTLRLTLLLKEYHLIIESFWQWLSWVDAKIRHKQLKLYNMTDPHSQMVIIEIIIQ